MYIHNVPYLPIFWLLLLCFSSVYTQEKAVENSIEEIISSTDNESISEKTADELSHVLDYYRQNPLNINTASRIELEELFFLNEFQISSLLDYRNKYGPLLSIYELPFVFGFDRSEAERLTGYICFENESITGKRNFTKKLLINKTEFRNTSKINKNLPVKIYSRYIQKGSSVSFGVTMENDPFEDFFKESNKTGFDFYSGFVEFHPKNKWLNNFIIGDYSVSFGQGLNVWGLYSTGKNIASPNSMRKRGQGFKPYTSSGEGLQYRGAATSFKFRNVQMNLFYSNKNIDAATHTGTDTLYFSSVQQSGYHRTSPELDNEKSIHEEILGMNAGINKDWYKGGITFHHVNFSIPLQQEGTPDKQFLPEGSHFEVMSADASFFLKNFTFFGEWAVCNNFTRAWLLGSNLRLPHSTSLSLLYRDYDRGFQSLYSMAVGENSENRNEKGTYIGISNTSFKGLTLNAYTDYFKFPWLTYIADAPTYGNEQALFAEYNFNDQITFSFKLKTETKEKSILADEESLTTSLEKYRKNTFRVQISYQLNENIQFKNRIETSSYGCNSVNEHGILLFHDMKLEIKPIPLTLYGRFTIFDTESFETRIYQYENDLLYSFYIPFLNGKGTKYYIMAKYKIRELLDIYFKTEYINYTDKEAVIVLKGELVWIF